MFKKGLLFAGALLLGGCVDAPQPAAGSRAKAAMETFTPTLDKSYEVKATGKLGQCTGVKCRITLAISDPTGACEPRPADPNNEIVEIRSSVPNPPRPTVLIVWTMLDTAYEFQRGDGITFKNGAAHFDHGQIINNGHEYQVVDKMDEKNITYNYKIQVTQKASGRKCVYDPGLVNDW